MNYLIDILSMKEEVNKEEVNIALKRYFKYLLVNYNKYKDDLDEILNGGSRLVENRRNNKISILLFNNESYNEAISEARLITDDEILKLDRTFSDLKNLSEFKQDDLEQLANELSMFKRYIEYLDNKLSEINNNYDISSNS